MVDPPIASALGGDGNLNRGGVSWSLFEGARNPYIILVTIYIFVPYVASVMVDDPVRGQAVISQWSQYTGWIVMLTAPLLGASIDQMGRRKIWLALLVAACKSWRSASAPCWRCQRSEHRAGGGGGGWRRH